MQTQRIHRLEGLQHAERVAADVARHDAIAFPQRLEHEAILAAVTELRRLARRLHRLRAHVMVQDAPDARHVQLAKAVHFRLAFDVDARGADRVHQARIAFLDHHAPVHAGGELRDLFHRERMRHAQFEQGRLPARLRARA